MTPSLSGADYGRVFPFGFAVDPEGRVTWLGAGLARLVPELQVGDPLDPHLRVTRPVGVDSVVALQANAPEGLVLWQHTASPLTLRGQVLAGPEGLRFLGGPWLRRLDELAELGLDVRAFPAHDATVDALFLVQAQRRAAEELRELTTVLRASEARAVEARDAMQDLLRSISHELRTPLHQLMGRIEVARARSAFGPISATEFDRLDHAALRLRRLLDRVFAVGELTVGTTVSSVDLGAVIEASLRSALTVIPAGRVEVVCAVPAGHPVVEIDRRALTVLLDELVSRLLDDRRGRLRVSARWSGSWLVSCQFTPERSSSALPPRLHLSEAVAARAGLRLRITNDRRGHTTVEFSLPGVPVSGSSALRGLRVSVRCQDPDQREAIEAHLEAAGARVVGPAADADIGLLDVRSGDLLRARQIVRLRPANEGTAGPRDLLLPLCGDSLIDALEPLQSSARTPLRVLVVDDAIENRRLASWALEDAGHQVESAADGVEALDALARGPFDVVLMDLEMPRLDGLSALRQAQELPALAPLPPIVAFTAHDLDSVRKRCHDAGFAEFVVKPQSAGRLVRLLERVARAPLPRVAPVTEQDTDDVSWDHPSGIDPADLTAVPTPYPAWLLSSFADDLAHRAKRLRRTHDADKARAEAHRIAGSSARYGYLGLARAARRLEEAAGVLGWEAIRDRLAQMAYAISRQIPRVAREEPGSPD